MNSPAIEVDEPLYLLWSGQHGAWHCPYSWKYTCERDEAARYTRDGAIEHVVRSADLGDIELVTRMVRE
jgi:hypothetical protein